MESLYLAFKLLLGMVATFACLIMMPLKDDFTFVILPIGIIIDCIYQVYKENKDLYDQYNPPTASHTISQGSNFDTTRYERSYMYDGRHSTRAAMPNKYKDILKMKEKAPQITLSEGQTFEIKKRGFIETINPWS